MKKCNLKLKQLLKDEVLPDIENTIDNIYEQIAKQKNTSDEINKELEQLHEMRDEFKNILQEIDDNKLQNQECEELYEGINAMIEGDFDFDEDSLHDPY